MKNGGQRFGGAIPRNRRLGQTSPSNRIYSAVFTEDEKIGIMIHAETA